MRNILFFLSKTDYNGAIVKLAGSTLHGKGEVRV